MKGFTLIEIIISVVLGVILVAAAAPLFVKLQASAQLNESTTQLIQTLRTARGRSIARVNNSRHGVYMLQSAENDAYVLYQGSSYNTRDANYDRTITLDPIINLTTTLIGNDINFVLGSGAPDQTGTITLSHETQGTSTIGINSVGKIEEQ